MIDVDLGPPSFSVKELGLRDMNIQEKPATVIPVSTLTCVSGQINLDDTTYTTVSSVPPDNTPIWCDRAAPAAAMWCRLMAMEAD